MNFSPLSDLMPALRRHISGPFEELLLDELRRSAITFCRNSMFVAVRRTIASAAAGDLLTICDIDNLKAAELQHVIDADGNPLQAGEAYSLMSSNEINVLFPWTSVTLIYAAEPLASSELLPSSLASDYGDEIAYGAAATLYAQKGRSWEDPDRSAYYSRLFTDGWRKAYRVRLENPVAVVELNPVRNHTFY